MDQQHFAHLVEAAVNRFAARFGGREYVEKLANVQGFTLAETEAAPGGMFFEPCVWLFQDWNAPGQVRDAVLKLRDGDDDAALETIGRYLEAL